MLQGPIPIIPLNQKPVRLIRILIPSWPKPNVRVMKGNSVKMTDILYQKAFEVYALEASRVTDTSFVLAAFVCSLICVIKQKRVPISFLSHSDALTIQHNRWNYRAK